MNGELDTNEGALNNRFAIYSTPGNAVIYIDNVRSKIPCTITAERGGLMAISVDEMTKTSRTLYTASETLQLDGATMTRMSGPWVNIDNTFGIITTGNKQLAFGERANNNSIMTACLYSSYADEPRTVEQDQLVDSRAIIYYSNIDSASTAQLSAVCHQLSTPEGWSGIMTADPDSTRYLLLSNFSGNRTCRLTNINTRYGAPVFTSETTITAAGSSATLIADQNHSIANTLKFFIQGEDVTAIQDSIDPSIIYLCNNTNEKHKIRITATDKGRFYTKEVKLNTKSIKVSLKHDKIRVFAHVF